MNQTKNKTIIIGSGRLGASIASMLSQAGKDVLLIDAEEDSFRKVSDSFTGYEIIGDATDLGVLENSYITQAEKVIITTDNDNVNVFLSHVCYFIYHVPKIFVRLSDVEKGKLLLNTTVQAIYPFILSMQEFIRLTEERR